MNTVTEVETHEKHASPTVLALRNALERQNPNHHDMCLMVGLLETWFDRATAADYSEQSASVGELWESMRDVYCVTPEQRGEFVRDEMRAA